MVFWAINRWIWNDDALLNYDLICMSIASVQRYTYIESIWINLHRSASLSLLLHIIGNLSDLVDRDLLRRWMTHLRLQEIFIWEY